MVESGGGGGEGDTDKQQQVAETEELGAAAATDGGGGGVVVGGATRARARARRGMIVDGDAPTTDTAVAMLRKAREAPPPRRRATTTTTTATAEAYDPWSQLVAGEDSGEATRKPFKAARTFLVLKDAADVAHRGPAEAVASARAQAATAAAAAATKKASLKNTLPLSCSDLLQRLIDIGMSPDVFASALGGVGGGGRAVLYSELTPLIIRARKAVARGGSGTAAAIPARAAGGAYFVELALGGEKVVEDEATGDGDGDGGGGGGDGGEGWEGGDGPSPEEGAYIAPSTGELVTTAVLDMGAAGDAAWRSDHIAREAVATRANTGAAILADRIAAAAPRLGGDANDDAGYWASVQEHIVSEERGQIMKFFGVR